MSSVAVLVTLVTFPADAVEPPADPNPLAVSRARVTVLDLAVGEDIKPNNGRVLAAQVREEIQKADLFELIDREMMKERMNEKDFAAISECDQVKCLVKYGKSLDVQKIVGGFVSSFGKTWTLTLRLVDVDTGKEEQTFSRTCPGDMECLLALSRQGTRIMLGLKPDDLAADEEKQIGGLRSDAKTLTLDLGGGVTMDLVRIEAGTFQMGSEDGEAEKPVHTVRISKPFYMGKTEVTQAQWKAVMRNNPSSFRGDDLPVEQVSWDDSEEFCRKLSVKVLRDMRLPTEAEWEYACRTGSIGNWCFGTNESDLQDYAWYAVNSGDQTHPVSGKKPNAWGLHDMHGNVKEWCQDWSDDYPSSSVADPGGPVSGEFRVFRSGSWSDFSYILRSSLRGSNRPGYRLNSLGFRVASGTTP